MKICKIWIKDWDQFKDIELDFTDPATGVPSEKICFIGSNGTGKSKLLERIDEFFHNLNGWGGGFLLDDMVLKIKDGENTLYFIFINEAESFHSLLYIKAINEYIDVPPKDLYLKIINGDLDKEFLSNSFFKFSSVFNENLKKSIHIFSPTESISNDYLKIQEGADLPIEEIISRDQNDIPQKYFQVNQSTITDFWSNFSSDLYTRKIKRDAFEELPENLDKTKKDLIQQFEFLNPKFEDKLSITWNKILERSNLSIKSEDIKLPESIKEGIKPPIKLKGSDKIIPYNLLSTGIRNYIFRLGHIYSLYFNREIDNGFLLVDEPENSLYPDFVYDIIDIYKEVCTDKRGEMNTQMFFATHSPMVASQFKKHERIILDWNDDGTVNSSKGYSPEGDDATDILANDFGSRTMPKKGEDMFNEYLKLKRELEKTSDLKDKTAIYQKLEKIGSEYNFL